MTTVNLLEYTWERLWETEQFVTEERNPARGFHVILPPQQEYKLTYDRPNLMVLGRHILVRNRVIGNFRPCFMRQDEARDAILRTESIRIDSGAISAEDVLRAFATDLTQLSYLCTSP